MITSFIEEYYQRHKHILLLLNILNFHKRLRILVIVTSDTKDNKGSYINCRFFFFFWPPLLTYKTHPKNLEWIRPLCSYIHNWLKTDVLLKEGQFVHKSKPWPFCLIFKIIIHLLPQLRFLFFRTIIVILENHRILTYINCNENTTWYLPPLFVPFGYTLNFLVFTGWFGTTLCPFFNH